MLDYEDPFAESILRVGPSGGDLVLVSDVAHVTSHAENGFDRQRKAGSNFGRVKALGIIPAKFTVTFVVLPEDEQHFWDKVYPLFRSRKKNSTAPPLDVVNPQINRIHIDTVFAVSIDVDPPNPRDGRQVALQLEEWTPAPVKTVKSAASSKKTDRNPLPLSSEATTKNQASEI